MLLRPLFSLAPSLLIVVTLVSQGRGLMFIVCVSLSVTISRYLRMALGMEKLFKKSGIGAESLSAKAKKMIFALRVGMESVPPIIIISLLLSLSDLNRAPLLLLAVIITTAILIIHLHLLHDFNLYLSTRIPDYKFLLRYLNPFVLMAFLLTIFLAKSDSFLFYLLVSLPLFSALAPIELLYMEKSIIYTISSITLSFVFSLIICSITKKATFDFREDLDEDF